MTKDRGGKLVPSMKLAYKTLQTSYRLWGSEEDMGLMEYMGLMEGVLLYTVLFYIEPCANSPISFALS